MATASHSQPNARPHAPRSRSIQEGLVSVFFVDLDLRTNDIFRYVVSSDKCRRWTVATTILESMGIRGPQAGVHL